MKKRRINFYCCAAQAENTAILMEAALAINGIKAVGYTATNPNNPPYDWEMQQKGVEESLIKACDMVIFDTYTSSDAEKAVLQEAQRYAVPAYVFRGNETAEVEPFSDCISTCNKLLGRADRHEPVLIN